MAHYWKKVLDRENYIYRICLVNPDEPLVEIQLFDFNVLTSTPAIYFEGIDTGIWDGSY